MSSMHRERELPMLGGIAATLRWLEELANIVAGPLLTAGLAIALIDLLTDGRLLASQPELLYAWAISQSVGVDMQLVGAWDKARQALRARRHWSLVGLLLLGVALATVSYLAAVVFAMQQSAGITTSEALARLGMNGSTWLVSRAALSVVLVCLSGWTRYHPPSAEASAEEERAKLQREMELEPLRAQLRAQRALGWRDVGRAITQGNAATVPESSHTHAPEGASPSPSEPPRRPPTGPGSPSQAATGGRGANTTPPTPLVLRLDAPAKTRRAAARASDRGSNTRTTKRVRTASVEAKVRGTWQAGMSVSELQRAAKISRNAAAKWARVLEAEGARSRDHLAQ